MRRPSTQGGVALIFALLALVALTMGAVALIRSVDSGVMALGNLSFKQSGLMSGGRAADQAAAWLTLNVDLDTVNGDLPDSGYYATSMDNLDVTGLSVGTANVLALVDWDSNGCQVNGQATATPRCLKASTAITVGADQVKYIITRLCTAALAYRDAGNNCATPVVSGTTESLARGSPDYGHGFGEGEPRVSPLYRIITRTLGPKATVSFTETIVQF